MRSIYFAAARIRRTYFGGKARFITYDARDWPALPFSPEMMTMDAWRPVSTAYGACSNTESANRREGELSAIGSESSASAVVGRHQWLSVIQDLALLLAARGEHDGIDWGRLVAPATPSVPATPVAGEQYDTIDWDCLRDLGERVP